jgi:hypothetical protein
MLIVHLLMLMTDASQKLREISVSVPYVKQSTCTAPAYNDFVVVVVFADTSHTPCLLTA